MLPRRYEVFSPRQWSTYKNHVRIVILRVRRDATCRSMSMSSSVGCMSTHAGQSLSRCSQYADTKVTLCISGRASLSFRRCDNSSQATTELSSSSRCCRSRHRSWTFSPVDKAVSGDRTENVIHGKRRVREGRFSWVGPTARFVALTVTVEGGSPITPQRDNGALAQSVIITCPPHHSQQGGPRRSR